MTSPDGDPQSSSSTRHFRIEGRVQGVGFRWWTRSRATQLGLGGYVRNCSDGSVEVVAAGPVEAVRALRDALHEGPPSASVIRVTEKEAIERPAGEGFEIR